MASYLYVEIRRIIEPDRNGNPELNHGGTETRRKKITEILRIRPAVRPAEQIRQMVLVWRARERVPTAL